jgi:tetratricopeptide (TPR) repeat protein
LKKIVIFVILFFLIIIFIQAQTGYGKGRLQGVVQDEKGNTLAKVKVEIQFLGQFVTRTVGGVPTPEFEAASGANAKIKFEIKTDKSGKWGFYRLGQGLWMLTATHNDFSPALQKVQVKTMERNPSVTLVMKKEEAFPAVSFEKSKKDLTASIPIAVLNKNARLVEGGEQLVRDKNYGELCYKLADFCLEHQETEEAIQYFHMAARLNSRWEQPHLRLGYIYMEAGNAQRARAHFQKFLKLAPQSEEAEMVQFLLETL